MEKEKPFLFTDLVPPGEVYIPDESDSIPIRTWSRGDPFDIGFDLGTIAPNNRGTKKISVGGSQSTDGMLHYTAFENENNDNEDGFVDEEDQNEEEEDQNEEEDGEYSADYDNEEDEGCIPNYGGVSYADIEDEFDKYMQGDDGDDGNEEYEEEDGEDEEGEYEEEEGFEEEDEDDVGGEEDDQVNYDDEEEDEYDAEHTAAEDAERFEKVALTPREMDLIRSSGPAEEYSDLVEIMNEYNQLVDCLASPRSHAKAKPAGKGGAQAKQGAGKVSKQSRAPAAPPVQRRLHAHSDSGSEEEDFMQEPHSDSDEDQHSASQHSLLVRNKLNIVAGMVAGAPVGKKQSTGVRKKTNKGKAVTGAKKPKKKLFGQALEDHKKMAMQLKFVSRSEVDEKQKVGISIT